MSSSEQSKILSFALAFIPTIFLIVGVIPAIFLGFGLYMMKKNRDFSYLSTGIKVYDGYMRLLIVGSFVSAPIVAISMFFTGNSDVIGGALLILLTIAIISFGCIVAMKFLFKAPLTKHSEWVQINGIFATKPKSRKGKNIHSEVAISNSKNLKQYSAADELTKWAKLKESGYISEEEFNKVKTRLLKERK